MNETETDLIDDPDPEIETDSETERIPTGTVTATIAVILTAIRTSVLLVLAALLSPFRILRRAYERFAALSLRHPRLSMRAGFSTLLVGIAAGYTVMPAAAQDACGEGAGAFIEAMQTEIGAIVLGILALITLVAIALILIPVAGTAAIGWTMIFAVVGGIFVYMLVFWLLGMMGDFGVLGMEDACTPFY